MKFFSSLWEWFCDNMYEVFTLVAILTFIGLVVFMGIATVILLRK